KRIFSGRWRGKLPGSLLAINKTGDKVMLLGQSYMPAQSFHILKNFKEAALNPWYSISNHDSLSTPEWEFRWQDLKTFVKEM
ncbi:DUF4846 domain-containing protein, partial [Candidatus Riflebacteria bacterium]